MRKKPRRRDTAPASAGLWNSSVFPWIERFALPLALCLVAIGAFRIVSSYRSLSLTTDEPYHFSCGLDYLATGRACSPENPPLQPLAAALLPFLDGVRPDPSVHARWKRREDIGRELVRSLLRQAADPWRLILRMRAGVLPFFVVASLGIFFGARHWFGAVPAVLSTALFTLVPTVLAHAGLATTDIALTATLGAAFFFLSWWSEAPSWPRAAWLGLAFGLAVFSKFSALAYFAAAAMFAMAFAFAIARPSRADLLSFVRARVSGLLVAGGVAAFTLWAGCLFSFGSVEGWPAWIKVPAPELFGGFRELMAHARRGHQTYLLGEVGTAGWWRYYPIALLVKTPIALLLAVAAGVWACWQSRKSNGLLPLAFCSGVLLVALTSRINIGVRHILPIFVGLSIVGGLGLVRLARISILLPAVLLIWLAASGARAHPDYISYFNEFGGDRPEEIIVDSDLEWDQSWMRVGRFLRARGAYEVTVVLQHADSTPADILERVYGLPKVHFAPQVSFPTPGWHVVDVGLLRFAAAKYRRTGATVHDELITFKGPSYAALVPVERIGGLLLFHTGPPIR